MATRRMISKGISISEQVNEMSLFAQLLFTWMISHADDWGILPGSPKVVKALVVPMHDISEIEVENAINEMIQQKLIYFYEVDETKYIQFRTWEKYQQGLSKRTASKYPSYADSLKFQEVPRNSEKFTPNRTELELNRTEEKGTELELNRTSECSCSGPEFSDEDLKAVASEYEGGGYGTINSTVSEMLISLIADYSSEWVIMALKEGVAQGKRKLSYVKGILKNWNADGGPKLDKGRAKNRGMPANVQSALDLVEKYKREEAEGLNEEE